MKELQEEYLFLNREGINGWEDVFRAKQLAEQRIADIDAKKKGFIRSMPDTSTNTKRMGM